LFFKNKQLTAALIDRLLEDSPVINMKNCVSLRPKLAHNYKKTHEKTTILSNIPNVPEK